MATGVTLSDFLARTHGAEPEAVWGHLVDYVSANGIKLISYHEGDFTPDGSPFHATLHCEGFPHRWVTRYVREELYRIDPIVDRANRGPTPFFWEDVAEGTSALRLGKAQRTFVEQLHKANIGDGVAVPVFGPHLHNGYFGLGFGGKRPQNASLASMSELLTAVQMAHVLVCNAHADAFARSVDLSPRERELLTLMADGHATPAIAQKMSISRHTIDTLTRRLFDKLKVSDRTAAVVKGIGAGLALVTLKPPR